LLVASLLVGRSATIIVARRFSPRWLRLSLPRRFAHRWSLSVLLLLLSNSLNQQRRLYQVFIHAKIEAPSLNLPHPPPKMIEGGLRLAASETNTISKSQQDVSNNLRRAGFVHVMEVSPFVINRNNRNFPVDDKSLAIDFANKKKDARWLSSTDRTYR